MLSRFIRDVVGHHKWSAEHRVPNLFPKTMKVSKCKNQGFKKRWERQRFKALIDPIHTYCTMERSGCILWVLKTLSAPKTLKTHSKLFSTAYPTDASDCVLDCNQKYPSSENHYYKWFSILLWSIFTKSLSQESHVPSLNFLLTNITYKWLPLHLLFSVLCGSAKCSSFHKSFPIKSMEKISNI